MYGANWCVGEQISTVEDSMGVKRDKWEYRETNGSIERRMGVKRSTYSI